MPGYIPVSTGDYFFHDIGSRAGNYYYQRELRRAARRERLAAADRYCHGHERQFCLGDAGVVHSRRSGYDNQHRLVHRWHEHRHVYQRCTGECRQPSPVTPPSRSLPPGPPARRAPTGAPGRRERQGPRPQRRRQRCRRWQPPRRAQPPPFTSQAPRQAGGEASPRGVRASCHDGGRSPQISVSRRKAEHVHRDGRVAPYRDRGRRGGPPQEVARHRVDRN